MIAGTVSFIALLYYYLVNEDGKHLAEEATGVSFLIIIFVPMILGLLLK